MKTKKNRAANGKRRAAKEESPGLELRLYVADTTARSVLARANLRSLCEQYLRGPYRLTIIDLAKEPEMGRKDEVLAIPTLVRVYPGPQKSVIGCLSDTERVLKALGLDNSAGEGESLLVGGIASMGHA